MCRKPRDVSQVVRWQYLKESIKGSIGDAIARFVAEGFLVHCDLAEVLTRTLQISDLKKLAADEGLHTTGTKSVLIERLMFSNKPNLQKLEVFKCSPQAIQLIEEFVCRRDQAFYLAKQNAL